MKFGEFKVEDSLGCILAHTVRAGGVVYKKGACLGEFEIEALSEAGVQTVTAVRMDAEDIDEDGVAEVIADALIAGGVQIGASQAGRCNLYASHAGMTQVDVKSIDLINQSGDGVLVATVRSFEVVESGRTIATVKVVPYALTKDRVAELVRLVSLAPAIGVSPFIAKKVGLVLSRVEGQKENLLDKAREVISARLETYGSAIAVEQRCPHATDDVAAALQAVVGDVDMVLILGAASTCDAGDVVPAAIENAGGEVQVVGIPVDPGNLLVAGQLDGKAVFGLPGCARSPSLNGVDIVLSRVLAGVGAEASDFMALGVGGLLHDVAERQQPREAHGKPSMTNEGSVAAVVLAAGASRRMGADNKLLKNVSGQPMVRRVVESALASGANPVIVVTGHEADRVRHALENLDVRFVHNPNYEDGLSSSVRVGIGHVPEACAGAMMLLGDMPKISADIIDALVGSFHAHSGQSVCVPVCEGRRGNPVVWPREFFPDMLDLSGDVGARKLFKRHQDRVTEIDVATSAIFLDVDTPDDLDAL